jgi:predicted enzyme related to lactoylglutathione lyase
MPIKGVAYVQLLVEHWAMALEFYRDIVGLEVDQLFEMEESVTFNLAGAKLVIYGGGAGSLQPKGADKNAFIPNLECEDLDATVAELEGRGVPFIAMPDESPEGYRLATFVDPEGNRFQLFEWAREEQPG